MRKSDGVVKAALLACELPIRAAKWFVQPASDDAKDAEVADFVSENLFGRMTITWDDFLRQALLMLPFGFMVFEKVFGPVDFQGREMVGWRKFAPRLPGSVLKWETESGNDGITQILPSGKNVSIPIEKLLIFTNQKEGDNWLGMALDLETDIPTPDGWKKMRDLEVGDRVFDEEGKIRYIVAVKNWKDRPSYKIKFSNGDEIIADENHKWNIEQGSRRVKKIVNTKEISKCVKLKNGKSEFNNWAIKLPKPVEYVEQKYLIDPYILGWWLSDGTSRCAEITSKDKETEKLLSGRGYEIKKKKEKRETADTYRLYGLQEQLRILKLLNNKHIPEEYKFGSVEQRLELVRGLMDGDGTVDRFGSCEFSVSSKIIAESFRDILASLGIKSTFNARRADKDDRRKLDIYRVHFTTDLQVFRLKRKIKKQKEITAKGKRIYIDSVEYAGKRDTKCIEVDSPSHIYLCGKTFIPTHNSVLRSAYRPWFFKKHIEKINAIAFERQGLGIPYAELPENYTERDRKRAEKLLKNIRANEQAYMIKPKGWDMGFIDMKAGTLKDPSVTIQRYNREILISVLAQFLDLGSGPYGSRALSADHSSTFHNNLTAIARQIRDVINKYAIKQLVDLNYTVSQYPTLEFSNIGLPRYGDVAKALAQLTQTGVIVPDSELEEHVRQLMEPEPEKPEEKPKDQPKQRDLRPDEDEKEMREMSEFVSWRELTFAEKKVNFRDIQRKMNQAEADLKATLGEILRKSVNELIRKMQIVLETPSSPVRRQKLKAMAVSYKGEYRKAILDTIRRLFEYGKMMSAHEMKKSPPATPAKAIQNMSKQADALTAVMSDGLLKAGKLSLLLGLSQTKSMTEILRKVSRAIKREMSSVLFNVPAIAVNGAINQGRRASFQAYQGDIYALQRSEILDSVTCNYCLSIDSRVFRKSDPFTRNDGMHSNCRGIWVEIMKEEREKPAITGIPASLRESFETINVFKPPRHPIIKKDSPAADFLRQQKLSKFEEESLEALEAEFVRLEEKEKRANEREAELEKKEAEQQRIGRSLDELNRTIKESLDDEK